MAHHSPLRNAEERTAQYGGRMFVFAATLGVQGDRACAMRTRLGENRNVRTVFERTDAAALPHHCSLVMPFSSSQP